MNRNKKYVASGLLLSAIIMSYGTSVFALGNQFSKANSDCDPDRHSAMEKAFLNNDYAEWASMMSDRGNVVNLINEDNFSLFAEAHSLAQAGMIEEARSIRTELGLGLGQKNGMNQGDGKGQKNNQDSNRQEKRVSQQMRLNNQSNR